MVLRFLGVADAVERAEEMVGRVDVYQRIL